MINTEHIYCLDVGGTQIKTAITNVNGDIVGSINTFEAKSDRSKSEILKNFHMIFQTMFEKHLSYHSNKTNSPVGIGLAFPGEFDYQNGICLMQNVDKYNSIYNVNLKEKFNEIFRSPTNSMLHELAKVPIKFINDVSAFALGESLLIPNTSDERIFCLCIGTGCGSAFLVNGIPVSDEVEGIPHNGWIYPVPYKDSILDDYLSKRGLLSITKSTMGREIEGLELSNLAKSGNIKAQECFLKFGEQFPKALHNVIENFGPNRLIFGGQIAKSFDFFGQSLEKFCDSKGIKLTVSNEASKSTIRGISNLFK